MWSWLGREISRSRRERVPTAILLCDVDHFKNINDTHGHLIGDEVLQEAARRLLLSVRSYDYVGRYGGMGVQQTQNWGVRTVEELLHEVDSAMYAAKAAARNRISFTKPDISSDADPQPSTVPVCSLR